MMKQYGSWIIAAMLIVLTSGTVYGRDVYREDIPDETFGQFLFGTFDQDKNGVLSDTECAAVTEIIVDDYGVIKSIEGIKFFPHLKHLMCDSNDLTAIDVTANTELEVLTFNHNHIRTVDLKNNPLLAELYCTDNELEELDLSANPALGYLDCTKNRLSALVINRDADVLMLKTDIPEHEIIWDISEVSPGNAPQTYSQDAEENAQGTMRFTPEQASEAITNYCIEHYANSPGRNYIQDQYLENESTYVLWYRWPTAFTGKYSADLYTGDVYESGPYNGNAPDDSLPFSTKYVFNLAEYL